MPVDTVLRLIFSDPGKSVQIMLSVIIMNVQDLQPVSDALYYFCFVQLCQMKMPDIQTEMKQFLPGVLIQAVDQANAFPRIRHQLPRLEQILNADVHACLPDLWDQSAEKVQISLPFLPTAKLIDAVIGMHDQIRRAKGCCRFQAPGDHRSAQCLIQARPAGQGGRKRRMALRHRQPPFLHGSSDPFYSEGTQLQYLGKQFIGTFPIDMLLGDQIVQVIIQTGKTGLPDSANAFRQVQFIKDGFCLNSCFQHRFPPPSDFPHVLMRSMILNSNTDHFIHKLKNKCRNLPMLP